MSTNFYFISKEDLTTEKKFNKFINNMEINIKHKGDKFLEKNPDSQIEDILYDLNKEFIDKLKYAYEPEEIHICKTVNGTIKFQANDNYGNMNELKDFYLKNKNRYVIMDEYKNKYSWSSFLKRIGYDKRIQYKWISYCFS